MLSPIKLVAFFLTISLSACSLSDLDLSEKPKQPVDDSVENDDKKPSLEHLFHPALAHDVNLAIATGDYQKSTVPNLTAALNTLHENSLQEAQTIKNAIFGKGLSAASAITWDPKHDSAILGHTMGVNHPIFVANDSPSGESTPVSLGIAGYKYGTPYLAMATNPFRTTRDNGSSVNDAMMQAMRNSVNWLTEKMHPLNIFY